MNSACNPFHRADPGFRMLYIFGAGGHGREVAWLAEQSWGSAVDVTWLVDQPEYLREPANGHRTLLLSDVQPSPQARYVVALGDPANRRKAVAACAESGHIATSIVHPRAELSRWVDIADGVVICAGVTITTNVALAAHVHVNVGCTLSHDVAIGEFSTLSPGVHVSGNVTIGRDVFIGTGACIINGRPGAPLVIGDGAVIAAGACVTRPVESGSLVAGVPAVRKR